MNRLSTNCKSKIKSVMKYTYSHPINLLLLLGAFLLQYPDNSCAQNSGPDDDYQPPNYSDEDRALILGESENIDSKRSYSPNEPDYSEETMARLRPLQPQAEAAYDRGDFPGAFAIYLKMWQECHIPIVRYHVLTSAWKCIDQDALEKGRHQSDSVYAILYQCPEPLFTDKGYSESSYGMENGIYGFVQYVLCQKENINLDFDSSGIYLARAEVYFERANELDPKTADINLRRDLISQGKNTLQRNGRIKEYYRAVDTVRNLFSGGSERPSSASASGDNDVDRFKARWRGQTATFTVTSDNGGSALDGTILVVRDSDTGKKFKVHYNVGLSKGLFDSESAVGHSVSIRFGDDGFPSSIKNPENGRGTQTSSGGSWVVEGFGW